MTDALTILTEGLSNSCSDRIVSYDGKILRCQFKPENKATLERGFKEFGIPVSFYPNNEFEIELNKEYNSNTILFLNEKEFLNRIGDHITKFDQLILIILQYEGKSLIKFGEEKFSQDKAIFFNTIQYRLLIDFIAHNTDFISFHDESEHRFLLFSGDKGPFFVGYNKSENKVKGLPNLELQRKELESAFSKIDYIKFFKEAVILGIHTAQEDERFFEIAKSLQVLMDIATRDHNIYLRQFGFDKIKAKFKEERVKYFDSIEKNIDSVSKQVTSFPLTFAASIFAGYQVREKPFILFLILAAYGLYTIVAWKILDVVAFNRRKIDEDVQLEKNNIQMGYQILFDDFKSDFSKIEDKVQRLKTLILLLRIVLIGLLLLFIAFCLYQNGYF